MKYNVLKFVTNTQGQYQAVVDSTFDDFKGARVKYHSLLAALANAPDVLVASVRIVDEYGNPMFGYDEVIDNRPEPEPEPEPTPEPEPEEEG